MWFKYDPDNALSFAYWYALWEDAFPILQEERVSAPAFSMDGAFQRFTLAGFSARFDQQLIDVLGTAEAALRSFHSCRVTFASLGMLKQYTDGTIQLLSHWKTAEAMRIYARMEPHRYAQLVEDALAESLNLTVPAPLLPPTGPEDAAAELEHALKELSYDPSDEKERQPKPVRGRPPTAPTPKAASSKGATRQRTSRTSAAAAASALDSQTISQILDELEDETDVHVRETYVLQTGQQVQSLGTETWGLVGLTLPISDFIFPGFERTHTRSPCDILAFIGDYCEEGGPCNPSYILRTHETDHYASAIYPVNASVLRRALPPAHRARLNKLKQPKALQQLGEEP
jgi:hypothetical protein